MAGALPTYGGVIHEQAVRSLFQFLETICEGAVVVDRESRIEWISENYLVLLGLEQPEQALGRAIEDVIPTSMMRRVVETGEPILLDIMDFKQQSFVVTRLPLRDEQGNVTGAVGFVLYDQPQYLKPLLSKFEKLQHDLKAAQRALAEHRRPRYSLSNFIGGSSPCMEAKRQARRAAQLDATVLLHGETGTGKELLAQAIHAISGRAEHPFIGVNVAAIPENLVEAEFFGVAPGAYTGAERRGRVGKLELADGGTLFLDEVGDMPLALQAKLLRVLQEQEFEPLGSNRMLRVDVRVIAATSRDLGQLVQEGYFRADLYYRLNVLRINIPPLRERLSDLGMLCEVMLERIAERTGLAPCELTPDAHALLAAHAWPGNVRELCNVLEQATMLSEGVRISAQDLRAILPPVAANVLSRAAGPAPLTICLADAVTVAERDAIRAALVSAKGNKVVAARLLGISRATLYGKLSKIPDSD